MSENVDLIISINVHEKPEYFLNQLDNINEHVALSKQIILNCNKYMFDELSKEKFENVVLNPQYLNKGHPNGLLLKGIFSNMVYALNNYNFKYFLIMSSREFFYNKLNSLEHIQKNIVTDKFSDHNADYMWWGPPKSSEFFNFLRENNLHFMSSAHEGLCFDKNTCLEIKKFAENNESLMETVWNLNNAAEEWVFQSIASNHNGFYYIGNGVYNKSLEEVDPDKFTFKKPR